MLPDRAVGTSLVVCDRRAVPVIGSQRMGLRSARVPHLPNLFEFSELIDHGRARGIAIDISFTWLIGRRDVHGFAESGLSCLSSRENGQEAPDERSLCAETLAMHACKARRA